MFLSRIRISNFRNFHELDVSLGPTTVVVGENNVGKSNLLLALRLVLDPRIADSTRQLRQEDFWDGLADPIKNKTSIEIAVEFQDFQADKNILTVLQPFLVPGPVSDTARLTYMFRPRVPLPKGREVTEEDYEFLVFGGRDEKNRVSHDVRRWIPLEVLPALRDAESDLSAWRQSPLRPLIERLQLPAATLESVANAIDQATQQLLAEKDVSDLTADIQNRLSIMVGSTLTIDPSLGFASTVPDRLSRALRLFGDGIHKRPVGELSLGVNNVLYLLLLSIELERKEVNSERATSILAIEEPEAHLHPHLQRLVFRDFLRRESPVLLTTHSPHIASVSPLRSIMLLRNDPGGDGSKGKSVADAKLLPEQIIDLERYLDATRAEIIFARGVILVEGLSELYLLPAFADLMGNRLDEHGISVCSVHGTDFGPYAKLLGPNGLNIPFVVVTDGDWFKSSNGEQLSRGLRRATRIATSMEAPSSTTLASLYTSRDWPSMYKASAALGIFVAQQTLEVDLFDIGYSQEVHDTLEELGASPGVLKRVTALVTEGGPLSEENRRPFLNDIERVGKGRFAQRFAGRLAREKQPEYLHDAIAHIIGLLSS